MDCLFCKIVVGQIPCHKVYEDENVLAFFDIHPCSKGHTVVIPKKHFGEIEELASADWGVLMLGVKETLEIINSKLKPAGLNVGINNRPAAGQAVPHLHWHIIPRYEGDKGGSMHSIVRSAKEGDLEKAIEEIK